MRFTVHGTSGTIRPDTALAKTPSQFLVGDVIVCYQESAGVFLYPISRIDPNIDIDFTTELKLYTFMSKEPTTSGLWDRARVFEYTKDVYFQISSFYGVI